MTTQQKLIKSKMGLLDLASYCTTYRKPAE